MQRPTVLLASMLLMAGAAQARNTSVTVPLDAVRMLAFDKPIATLYIGNPVIADITMIDKRHAFIQGKAYGATNVVALDASGDEISNQQVIVFGAGGGGVVTLQRGAAQTTYSCAAARCEPTPQPGDGKDPFDQNMGQIQAHQALVAKAAGGGQ